MNEFRERYMEEKMEASLATQEHGEPIIECVNHDCDKCTQEQGEPVAWAEFVDRACGLIKAADDAAAENDYMLDSDNCISVLRGTWKGNYLNDHPQPKAKQEQRSDSEQLGEPVVNVHLKTALQKIESALRCHPNAVLTLIGEAWNELNEAINITPQQRKPMTNEQIDAIWDAVITPSNHICEFVRAIEAAHGIAPQAKPAAQENNCRDCGGASNRICAGQCRAMLAAAPQGSDNK